MLLALAVHDQMLRPPPASGTAVWLQIGQSQEEKERKKEGLIDFSSSAARTKNEGPKNALTDSGWHAVVGAELEIHQTRRHHMPCLPFESKAMAHRLQDPLEAFSGTRCLSATSVVGGRRLISSNSLLWMKVINHPHSSPALK
jgi:hypothetical protein